MTIIDINQLINSVDIVCPKCGYTSTVKDLQVSVSIEKYPALHGGVTLFTCKNCKNNIRVEAKASINTQIN